MKRKITIVLSFILMFTMNLSFIYAKEKVYLGGDSIAIELFLNGVSITGSYPVQENFDALKDNGLEKGDLITEADGKEIQSISELFSVMKNNKDNIFVTVYRDGKKLQKEIKLWKDQDGTIKSGLYVKDKISGTGTMTFYLPGSQSYGALGHQISDEITESPSGVIGYIYPAEITGINKSIVGSPGEKIGKSTSNQSSGNILKNNIYGLFGKYSDLPDQIKEIEIATQDEVEIGYAQMYTVLEGSKVEAFDIEILQTVKQNKPDIKGIRFKITDPRAIEQCGGVVQGMSGSPIVQNGKLIGAVTHMITSNPTHGYGLYIENMLDEVK